MPTPNNHVLKSFQRLYGKWLDWREAQEFNWHAELRNLYQVFKSSPEGEWIIGRNDALNIYTFVKHYGSKNALDLGTGIGASAAVLALAVGENGQVTTVEQFPKCIEIAREIIPAYLQPRIRLIFSEPRVFQHPRISKYLSFSGYKDLPLQYAPFDFVVIDGPSSWMEGNELVGLNNGDIIALLPHLAPGCKIYVDDRRLMVDVYTRYLSRYLRVLDNRRVYALLERTDTPLQSVEKLAVVDTVLEKRRKSTYFRNAC